MFLSFGGKGGFPWPSPYELPIRIRRLAVQKLQEILEAEHKAASGKGSTQSNMPAGYNPATGTINRSIPNLRPKVSPKIVTPSGLKGK